MQGNFFTLSFTLFFLIGVNCFCLIISKKYVDEISASAHREYQLHACGRALAAVKNFETFARNAVRKQQISKDESQLTLSFIENALKQRNQDMFMLTQNHCVERANTKPAAVLYFRNESHTSKNSPNYSYRLL
jgi:hypothetical protein